MRQLLTKILFLLSFIVGFGVNMHAQSKPDSLSQGLQLNQVDSAIFIVDTTAIIPDSLKLDSLVRADSLLLDSLGPGVMVRSKQVDTTPEVYKDTMYYSLYGYKLHIDDTQRVEKWKYNTSIHSVELKPYDSTLLNFHKTTPFYNHTISSTQLGGVGLAGTSNLHFEPTPQTSYIFSNSFTPYLKQSDDTYYYSVKHPFTLFKAYLGPKDEQSIGLIHSQNANPFINFFFKYNSISSKGIYVDQDVRNSSGQFGGSINYSRFSTHSNWSFGKIVSEENGGIVDASFITDTTLSEREIATKIQDGSTQIEDRQFFFDQKVGFVKTRVDDSLAIGGYLMSIQYNFTHHKSNKQYKHSSDSYTNPITNETLNFYENNYSGLSTRDSNAFIKKTHLIRYNLEEVPDMMLSLGLYGGFGSENVRYGYRNTDTLFINDKDTTVRSNFFEVGVYKLIPKGLKFWASYKVFTNGYRAGDTELKGAINQSYRMPKGRLNLDIWGDLITETPDYFYSRFRSNNFRWDNNFDKVIRTHLEGKLSYPAIRTSIGARYKLINNHIYFNNKALPQQYDKQLSVFDFYLKNHLKFWKLNLTTNVHYQASSNQEVLPLPTIAYYGTFYFGDYIHFKSTKGDLQINLGVDCQYWTSFYAPGYNPALSIFHMQNEQEIGNYPFMSAFASLEIKTIRLFLKYDHITYDLVDKNYFTAPGYPTPQGQFRYGLVWTFYD